MSPFWTSPISWVSTSACRYSAAFSTLCWDTPWQTQGQRNGDGVISKALVAPSTPPGHCFLWEKFFRNEQTHTRVPSVSQRWLHGDWWVKQAWALAAWPYAVQDLSRGRSQPVSSLCVCCLWTASSETLRPAFGPIAGHQLQDDTFEKGFSMACFLWQNDKMFFS